MESYKQTTEEVLKKLSVDSSTGLSDAEVETRRQQYGLNLLHVKGEPLWKKLIEPFKSIFIVVLLAAAGVSIYAGEPLDAAIIIAIITISAAIYYVQRFSSERVLNALKQHDIQNIDVLRNSVQVKVNTTYLVPGDIITLHEGEKVPADSRVISSQSVRVDEALLTGESSPVTKTNHALQDDKQVYERSNLLFQGSFVVSGNVTAVVVSTGDKTEFGRLAALAQQIDTSSPMQEKIDKLITQIILAVGVVAALVLTLSLGRGMELTEAIRYMITFAVSAVPEGLPVAISVVLVLGMRRLAKHRTLVRSMRAIENVGILTCIATDKTGTLTKNQLSVQDTWQLDTRDLRQVAGGLKLSVNSDGKNTHDPLDTAMLRFADEYQAAIPKNYELVHTLPFDLSFAMSGNVWKHPGGYDIYLKGAPEKILERTKLSEADHEKITRELHSLTGQGFRVIALATLHNLGSPVYELSDVAKKSLKFNGLIAVADQLRPEAHASILTAQEAGVSVKMITGDHFETAYAIGKKLGLAEHRSQVFDCRQIDTLSDAQLEKVVVQTGVFSRVTPESKHKLLSILKKTHITAMTGDGVNDVPALSNAHIGIAMGSGSQIAKEAGDIVLLDDSFAGIVEALRQGRIIFANIRRMLFYLLATSAGDVIVLLGALLAGLPLPLVPVQILWINLVTDTAMVIPLGLEPAEDDVMKRRPRRPKKPIIGRVIISRMILVALAMGLGTLAIFTYFLQNHGVEYARTIAFNSLVVMQWANAFNARSEWQSLFTRLKVHNYKLYVGLAVAALLQALAMFGPLRTVLHIETVELNHLLISGGLAILAIIAVSEVHKFVGRNYFDKTA